MKLWWELYPGRLEYEINKLQDAGIVCELDEKAFAEGIAVLHLMHDTAAFPDLKLKVVFPDMYPKVPFEVFAPNLSLSHHLQPFDKNLCFLDDPGNTWRTDDTVAGFIRDRLPMVLEAGGDEKNDLEVRRSEPISNYLHFQHNSIVLVDGSWTIPSQANNGRLVIGSNELIHDHAFRGAVLEVKGAEGTVIAHADERLCRKYNKRLTGRWVRFPDAPKTRNVRELFDYAVSLAPHLRKPFANPGDFDIIGIVFPEELAWREEGDSWIFIVRKVKKNGLTFLVRGGRSGTQDLLGRNPSLVGLHTKTIAMFGLGCLGGPSAMEFARSGVGKLRLLDDDYVEPSTTVRWPFGLHMAAGIDKSPMLKYAIAADYPFTEVDAFVTRLGKAVWPPIDPPGQREKDIIKMMVDGADLIFDATAEFTINNMLAGIASDYRIPYIAISGTPGMWGGCIIRILPGDEEPCWNCIWHAFNEGLMPRPFADLKNGLVAPEGCSAPTFSGTSFDASVISSGGVRLAISTLMEGLKDGYPSTPWNVAVINLRNEHGHVIPPTWQVFKPTQHHNCYCKSH